MISTSKLLILAVVVTICYSEPIPQAQPHKKDKKTEPIITHPVRVEEISMYNIKDPRDGYSFFYKDNEIEPYITNANFSVYVYPLPQETPDAFNFQGFDFQCEEGKTIELLIYEDDTLLDDLIAKIDTDIPCEGRKIKKSFKVKQEVTCLRACSSFMFYAVFSTPPENADVIEVIKETATDLLGKL